MSKIRTKQIESGIERNYRSRGRSAAEAHHIAGAVMGNIKRERKTAGAKGYAVCMRDAKKDRSKMGVAEYKKAVNRCKKLGK